MVDLGPPPAIRPKRLAVFLTEPEFEFLRDLAETRGQRPGTVATLLISATLGSLMFPRDIYPADEQGGSS